MEYSFYEITAPQRKAVYYRLGEIRLFRGDTPESPDVLREKEYHEGRAAEVPQAPNSIRVWVWGTRNPSQILAALRLLWPEGEVYV